VDAGRHTLKFPEAVSVRLDFAAVDHILSEVMQGFGSVPKRGAEVGGLLLGTVAPGKPALVHIHDFVPVTSEHARGPSYLLSPSDEARLVAALERIATLRPEGRRLRSEPARDPLS
jgi:hypothetical protein